MPGNALLTLFKSTNFGTVAQASALARATSSTVVNYVDEKRLKYYRARRSESVEAFVTWNTEFKLTKKLRSSEEIVRHLNEHYDRVIVGSDELLKFRTAKHRGVFLQDFPTAFWLPRTVNIRKVLYAASIGPIHYGDVAPQHLKQAVEMLEDFEYLSVRDQHTWDFIRHSSPVLARRVELVPDPTWLYWPRVLFETPLQFMKTTGVANSFHNLTTHLMRCHKVDRVSDSRPKTTELASDFRISDWDENRIIQQCMDLRTAGWNFIEKAGLNAEVSPEPAVH